MQNKNLLLTALLGASSISINTYAKDCNKSDTNANKHTASSSEHNSQHTALSKTAVQLASPNDVFNLNGSIHN